MSRPIATCLALTVLSGFAIGSLAQTAASTPDQESRLVALTRTVETAEAMRSVKRLQWAYGHYSELGLWYDFADLFADTGIGHYTQGDLNRDQIRALFYDQVGQGRLGLAQGRIYPHISFSPVIDLDDDGLHAKGRFRILAMLGGYGGNATWFHGVYENVYVKERGVWKLNETSNTAQVTGNFKAGLSASSKPPLDAPTFPFHFSPQQVGAIAVSTAELPGAELSALQQRLVRLDDEAAIVKLQHQYGYYLDQHDWKALTGLFADNGTFESGQQGVYVGKASISKALSQLKSTPLAQGEVDEHILFQTYVSVAPDGHTAKARVDQLGMQGKPGGSAEWTQGLYENTFVKENGKWRIQALHYYPRLITDYDKGWGVDAQPVPGPSTTVPPDAPPSEKYEIYPTFYIPAFHFNHPVTGKAPQYPDGDPAIGKAIGFAAVSPPADAVGQKGNLQMRLTAAEAQGQHALAVDAVENLVNAYAYYLDECRLRDAAALFAGTMPRSDECAGGRQQAVLTLHHALQPVITVASDGKSATITARLWLVHATAMDDDYYRMGLLQGRAVKQGGQWKLASLTTHYQWTASVREGWAHAH